MAVGLRPDVSILEGAACEFVLGAVLAFVVLWAGQLRSRCARAARSGMAAFVVLWAGQMRSGCAGGAGGTQRHGSLALQGPCLQGPPAASCPASPVCNHQGSAMPAKFPFFLFLQPAEALDPAGGHRACGQGWGGPERAVAQPR